MSEKISLDSSDILFIFIAYKNYSYVSFKTLKQSRK